MAYVHIAHDCVIGNKVIISNATQIAGHVKIEDVVIIGGQGAVHQFCKIGQHAMVGGGGMVGTDIPPYVLVSGYPARYMGLNIVGLKRRNFSSDDINTLKDAYKIFYNSKLKNYNKIKKIKEKYIDHPLVKNIIDFIESSERGVVRR